MTDVPGGVGRHIGQQIAHELVQPVVVADHAYGSVRQDTVPLVAGFRHEMSLIALLSTSARSTLVGSEVLAFIESGQQQKIVDQCAHSTRFGLDAFQRVFGRGGQVSTVLPGQFGIAHDGGQRRSEFVAGIGEHLPNPTIRFGALHECGIDIGQQTVQRMTDDPDVGYRCRVGRRNPAVIRAPGRRVAITTLAAVAATRRNGASA